MAIIPNAISFGSAFNITAKSPIDARLRVEFISDLTSVFTGSDYPAYDSMIVSVLEDGHVYRLHGTDSTVKANWRQLVDDIILNERLSNTSSIFQGTASYAANGPFLHISGGVVVGSVIFEREFAQGYNTSASGSYAHAEGYESTASGRYAHAEGGGTLAKGDLSHAEGRDTVAEEEASHAEGNGTQALGRFSHAEGSASKALGLAAHAEGDHTEAVCDAQTVVGRFNDPSFDYAFVVGTGTGSYTSQSGEIVPTSRENALGVRWDGDIDMIPSKILYGTASYALMTEGMEAASVNDARYIKSGSCILRIDPVAGEFIFEIDGKESTPVQTKYMQDLIDEGYASVEVKGGVTYITIHTDCPYAQGDIKDFNDIISNKIQLDGAIANTLKWSEALPAGWSSVELAKAYSDSEAFSDLAPLEELFWGIDMGDVDEISLKFRGASWNVISNGLFSPRGNTTRTTSPKVVNITIDGTYSSILQTYFTGMFGTSKLNFTYGTIDCHDVAGMFEYSKDLEEIVTNGTWYLSSIRDITNMFHGCSALKEIPLGCSTLARDHSNNTLRCRRDPFRGTSSYEQTFYGCSQLERILPTLDLFASTTDDTKNNTFKGCTKLHDVRIKNLNNCDWDFTSDMCYLPFLDAESVNYLLQNVASNVSIVWGIKNGVTIEGFVENSTDRYSTLYWTDSSKTAYTVTDTGIPVTVKDVGGFVITLNADRQSEIASSLIAEVESKGWSVVFKSM